MVIFLTKEPENYTEKHWEDIVILLTLLSVAAIHYFIYSKFAFLDFFYLVIVLAGYYVGKRLAILGAFFAIIMVWVFVLVNENPYVEPGATMNTHLNLTVWGGFLILAAWLVGTLSEKRKHELKESNQLRQELEVSCQRLNERNRELEKEIQRLFKP
jgi:type VI protein secretion system component VasK